MPAPHAIHFAADGAMVIVFRRDAEPRLDKFHLSPDGEILRDGDGKKVARLTAQTTTRQALDALGKALSGLQRYLTEQGHL
jgi:hypothetical protein